MQDSDRDKRDKTPPETYIPGVHHSGNNCIGQKAQPTLPSTVIYIFYMLTLSGVGIALISRIYYP